MAVVSCTGVDSEDRNPEDRNPEDLSYVKKTKMQRGSVAVWTKFMAHAVSSAKIYVAMPFPETNQYQDIISAIPVGNLGETESGEGIIYKSEKYSRGSDVDLTCGYEVNYQTYSIDIDFSQIKEIHPYDTEGYIYKNYLGCTGEYIVPTNPEIVSIASLLWEESKDVLDYARRCYEYTASNYIYLNANTGLHTLADNLKNGGGDCGNLSAIYLSLLRNKEIPARPVVCIRPDGSFHVWSEFYLEVYGWIPVDVTYKNFDSRGNYFGVYPGDCIVVSNEYDILLKNEDGTFSLPLLQTYAYWYWNMAEMSVSYNISPVLPSEI